MGMLKYEYYKDMRIYFTSSIEEGRNSVSVVTVLQIKDSGLKYDIPEITSFPTIPNMAIPTKYV